MTSIEIVNFINKYFLLKGYTTDIDLSMDYSHEKVCPQISINVVFNKQCNEMPSFFFSTLDDSINFAAFYVFDENVTKDKHSELINKGRSLYGNKFDIIEPDVYDENEKELHIFKAIKIKDFSDSFLKEIEELFTNDNDYIKELRTLDIKAIE